MQIGEEKKEGNRCQDLCSRWQEARSHGHQRNSNLSPSQVPNRNTWHSFTLSRSRYGSSVFSGKSATTSAIKTSSTATIRALSHLYIIRNTMLAPSTSTSNIISSGTALRMEQRGWNIVQACGKR